MYSIHVPLFFLIINLTIFNSEKSISIETISSKSNDCADEAQELPNHETIIWNIKLTDTNYLSTPICLDDKFNYKTRKCTGDTFEPVFDCASVQKTPSKCPLESTEKEIAGQTVCFYINEATKYSESICKYKNAAAMSNFVNDINQFTIEEVWYPASKVQPYNIFLHDEITENYKTIVVGVEYEDNTIEGKNCLKINRLGQLIAVSCDDKYNSLCIFKILADLQEYSYCRLKSKNGYFINNYDLSKARCLFNVGKRNCNSEGMERAEFLEPYQNFIMPFDDKINNHVTALTYSAQRGGFYWSTSNTEATYSYWSKDVAPNKPKIVRNVPDGWSAKNSFSDKENYICQSKQAIQFVDISVQLSLSNRDFTFRLGSSYLDFARVGNGLEAGFCFTNTAKGLPISRVDMGEPVLQNNELVYTFNVPISQHRGSYWCEGFKLPDFSQSADMRKEHSLKGDDNYIVYVTVEYFDGENPLDPQPVPARTVELFEASLNSFQYQVNVKWSGVHTINKASSMVTYILNIWSSEEGMGESDTRLFSLEELIRNNIAVQQEIIWTGDVFSSYYCRPYLKSDTNHYYWEKTNPGSTKEVYCQDGLKSIKRNCLKDNDNDYIKGVRWSEIIGVCPEDCLGQKQMVNKQEINWDVKISTTIDGDLYISTPICLDNYHSYITRLKKDGCFVEQPPKCSSLQEVNPNENSSQCPPGYKYNRKHQFCFSIANKVGKYPPICPYPNNLSPAQLTEEMIRDIPFEEPLWFPARRYHKYGYTYFLYDEYSRVYKRPVEMLYRVNYLNGEIANKDCVVLKKSREEIFLQAVACEQQYTHVCVYPILQEQTNSHCQLVHGCYHNDFNLAKSKCICPNVTTEDCTLAEFLYEYQSYKITNTMDVYKIGLAFDGNKNRYSWASSKTDLTYSLWSKQLDPKKDVYLNHAGWIQGSSSDLKLCQIEINFQTEKPELLLTELLDKFIMVLKNSKDIVRSKGGLFCFTDAGSKDIITAITDLQTVESFIADENREMYEFSKPTISGNYWCEVFIYPNLENVQSNRILVNDFNHYVFFLTITFVEGQDPTNPAFVNIFIIDKLQRIFTDASLYFVTVAWSKTLSIKDFEKEACYCLNLKTNKELDYKEDELQQLELVLENVEDSGLVDITDLLSSHYCRSLAIDGYLWTQKEIGLEATVQCPIGGEDDVLTRTCEGDFSNGGRWGNITGTCPTMENCDCESLPGDITSNIIWDTKISNSEGDPHTNYYISTPICLDEDRVPKTRICVDQTFGEEPTCNYTQDKINRCPENLTEHQIGSQYFCYVVKEHQSNCPFKNTVPFAEESTKSLMLEVLKHPVWFPAGRNKRFSVSYLMVNEPSADYMINISYKTDDEISKKSCAIINPSNGRIEAVKCDEKYKSFCAYLALGNDEFSSCSLLYGEKCYNTNFDLSKQTSCHCRRQFNDEKCKIAELHLPYQNFIIPKDSKIAYVIDICAKAWCSGKKLEYSFWSDKLIYADTNSFLTYNGWQQKHHNEESMQNICEKPFSYRTATLKLSNSQNKFTIELSEPYNIVRKKNFDVVCFTDSINDNLLLKITPQLETSNDILSVYWFSNNLPNISGNYWCEAFGYPHSDLITSDVYFYDSGYNNYVVKIGTRYETLQNPLNQKYVVENVVNPLQEKFTVISKTRITVRWMDTLEIDDNKRQVIYLLHLTTETTRNNEAELIYIEELVKIAVEDISNVKQHSEVLSSTYCPSDEDLWQQTECGQTIAAEKMCLEHSGKNIQRTCEGDFTKGCRWKKPTGSCALSNEDNSKITNDLYDILISNISDHEIVTKLIDLTVRNEEFKMIDVFLTAVIFEKISPDCITISDSGKIVSNVMNIDKTILHESQIRLNSTDKILYDLDKILLNKSPKNQNEELIRTGDVCILIFDSKRSDVNGVSIILKKNQLNYEFLYKNLTDLNSINERDLILATHIPVNLLNQIGNKKSFLVRLTIFLKDTLFNERVEEARFNGGKNIGILLPPGENFKIPIPIILKPQYEIEEDLGQCGFWNYGLNNNAQAIRGSWLGVNKMQILQDNIRCEFDHTTHFAFLIMGSQSDFEKTILQNSHVLLIITTVECVLSIVGILGICATAILFKTWRRNKGNQILLQLSIVTFFQFVFLYISGAIKDEYLSDDTWCFGVGVALHYTVLAQFCWMLVIAYLQYKRFVHVFKRSQSLIVLKSCIVGYVLPAIPVLYLVFADEGSYLDKSAGICYPSGDGLTLAVVLPIGSIIFINILLFVCIIFNIFFPKSRSSRFDDDLLMLRFRLVFVLFFMLGMTWIFGILGQITRNIMFLFLFSLTASLQGFVLFMFFIVFNKRSRRLYVRYIKKKRNGM